MKIVFLSNYYNHHQSALARRLQRLSEGWFSFIKTTEIGAERVALGWKSDEPEYVVSYASDPERAQAAIEVVRQRVCSGGLCQDAGFSQ